MLTNEECERVRYLTPDKLPALGRHATTLTLDWTMREAARARVPPPEPRPRLDVPQRILVVDRDPTTGALLRRDFPGHQLYVATTAHDGVCVAKSSSLGWSLVLLDARFAFGSGGVLRRLPFEQACRAFVLAHVDELADARWRLGDASRILTRPVSVMQVWRALVRTSGQNFAATATELPQPAPVARKVTTPPIGAPLRVLLVDVEGEFDLAFGRMFGGEIEFVAKKDVDESDRICVLESDLGDALRRRGRARDAKLHRWDRS